jgi:hypothetical protein
MQHSFQQKRKPRRVSIDREGHGKRLPFTPCRSSISWILFSRNTQKYWRRDVDHPAALPGQLIRIGCRKGGKGLFTHE